jgi:alpha-D-ribose 1-methylphosphonate 5-triphosphate synthase subunit PhnL
MSETMLLARGLHKAFVLHLQGGTRLDVLRGAALTVAKGEGLALSGPSGAGKSTMLRALYRNYLVDGGEILVNHLGAMVDIVSAPAETMIDIRRGTLGYVSQFLRAIPRISALDIVAAAALDRGMPAGDARLAAADMLARLGIGARLHNLPPATFSGGEQQRVNLARAFICHWPILLLDEPTASLDAGNRDVVIGLINDAKAEGSAVIGIFHDPAVRDAVTDRQIQFHLHAMETATP